MTEFIDRINTYWNEDSKIREARETFFEKGVTKRGFVSDELAFSWLRCKYKNIDHREMHHTSLKAKRLTQSKDRRLNSWLSDCWIGKFNNQGELLFFMGPNALCQQFSKFNAQEANSGFNGISGALESNTLSVVIGLEHYMDELTPYVSIGYPNANGVMGILIALEVVTEDFLLMDWLSDLETAFELTKPFEMTPSNNLYFLNPSILAFEKCIRQYHENCQKSEFIYLKASRELPIEVIHTFIKDVRGNDANQIMVIPSCQFEPDFDWLTSWKSNLSTLVVYEPSQKSAGFQNQLVELVDSKLINSKLMKANKSNTLKLIVVDYNSDEINLQSSESFNRLKRSLEPFKLDIPPLKTLGTSFKAFLQAEVYQNYTEGLEYDLSMDDEVLNALTKFQWQNDYLEWLLIKDRLMLTDVKDRKAKLLDLLKRDACKSVEAQTLKEQESYWIQEALKRHGFNIKQTAEVLGITRSTLYAKMKAYGINN